MKTYTDEELIQLWADFGDTPIDNNDFILQPFLHFPIGTDRFLVWHWFDERYSKGVHALLYEN